MLRRHVQLASTNVLPRTHDMRWHVSGRSVVLAYIASQLRVDSTGRIDANIEFCQPGHLIFVDKANSVAGSASSTIRIRNVRHCDWVTIAY
jgi:hypothetical protein